MSRPPGPREPNRKFEQEHQIAGSGATPGQVLGLRPLVRATHYYAVAQGPDGIAQRALDDIKALMAPELFAWMIGPPGIPMPDPPKPARKVKK